MSKTSKTKNFHHSKTTASLGKTELVRLMATKLSLPLKQVELFLTVYMETISENLSLGKKIVIPGFITHEVKARAARTGRNPATGEIIEIPAARIVSLRSGSLLKLAVAKTKTK